jgi:AraC-like DNA-binding protein
MYIPLATTSLAHIFGSSELILPVKYLKNRISDIQNIYPNHILLSKKRWVNECGVSIEVDLEENKLYKLNEDFYLYDMPIQLSKIKNILFLNNEQMKRTVGNIEISQGFVPEQLLKIDKSPEPIEFIKPKKRVKKPKDISKKITLFRKKMGALIFAKNFLKKDTFAQYVDEVLSKLEPELKKIISTRMVEREDIEKIAKKENIKLEYFRSIIKRKKIPVNSLTYLLVQLLTHKPFMECKFIGFFEDIKESVPKETLEKYIIIYSFMAGYNELSFKIINNKESIYFRFRNNKEDLKVLDDTYKNIFKDKISRKKRLEEIESLNLEEVDILELSEKFGVSEKTIRKDIREVFGIKKIRIEKYLKLKKLRKLLEKPFSTREVSEKLEISLSTTRKYLKEIGALKESGKTPLYFL